MVEGSNPSGPTKKGLSLFSQKFTLMGILNATPDSFSGDGVFLCPQKIKQRISTLLQSGCKVIDVGGESTRPGFLAVSDSEEWDRVSTVLSLLQEMDISCISIDSTKPVVIEKALLSGVQIINDVNGFCDLDIIKLAQKFNAYCIVMHNARMPRYFVDDTLQGIPLVQTMIGQLKNTVDVLLTMGISPDKIIIDPGIGFGKTFQQNWDIVKYCDHFKGLGYPVLLAASRKSFIGSLCDANVDSRLGGSLGVIAYCFQKGISFFRVHDAYESNQLLQVMSSLI
ncbi:MAG: dihydropteroate synthase [Candidatus Puniceispirillum sp.]|nr:dihydropteroate synthase [Candidatus Pelagibacter sp.]MBA4282976.1 dihydropteroate synthase [Candidatus Puniceispirillum sp.]